MRQIVSQNSLSKGNKKIVLPVQTLEQKTLTKYVPITAAKGYYVTLVPSSAGTVKQLNKNTNYVYSSPGSC